MAQAAEIDASGDIQKTYGYWPDSSWTTNPLFQKIGDDYYWYLNDHLGTSQVIVDAYGSIKWQGMSATFGETQIVVDQVANNLRFPGNISIRKQGYITTTLETMIPRPDAILRAIRLGWKVG